MTKEELDEKLLLYRDEITTHCVRYQGNNNFNPFFEVLELTRQAGFEIVIKKPNKLKIEQMRYNGSDFPNITAFGSKQAYIKFDKWQYTVCFMTSKGGYSREQYSWVRYAKADIIENIQKILRFVPPEQIAKLTELPEPCKFTNVVMKPEWLEKRLCTEHVCDAVSVRRLSVISTCQLSFVHVNSIVSIGKDLKISDCISKPDSDLWFYCIGGNSHYADLFFITNQEVFYPIKVTHNHGEKNELTYRKITADMKPKESIDYSLMNIFDQALVKTAVTLYLREINKEQA